MALMRMKVTMADAEPVSVKVTPKVIVAAERHFKKGMGELFANASYEALAWVAWQAMQANGHVVKTFDLWLDGVDEITAEDSGPLVDGA